MHEIESSHAFADRAKGFPAERHRGGYDAVAERTRFILWLAQHVDPAGITSTEKTDPAP
jgi:hypothetical protein